MGWRAAALHLHSREPYHAVRSPDRDRPGVPLPDRLRQRSDVRSSRAPVRLRGRRASRSKVRGERGRRPCWPTGFEGKRLNIPNDLAIDPQGRVWFTDPYYEGAGGPWSEDRSNKELDHDSVYRLDPQTNGEWSINRVTYDTTRPNGLLFSLDHETLYVAQSGREPEEKRELRSYAVLGDGSLGPASVLHDFGAHRGIDGMCLDTEGNIVATAGYRQGGPGPMVYVFSPAGEVLEAHPVPEDRPTNCSFGGPELTTLYVTTGGGHLLEARTHRRGRLWYPPIG